MRGSALKVLRLVGHEPSEEVGLEFAVRLPTERPNSTRLPFELPMRRATLWRLLKLPGGDEPDGLAATLDKCVVLQFIGRVNLAAPPLSCCPA
jgi:hypothetical protein